MYSRWRVETRFYLFHGTLSLREDLGRYAPVTAAAVLTLNTIDIHCGGFQHLSEVFDVDDLTAGMRLGHFYIYIWHFIFKSFSQ